MIRTLFLSAIAATIIFMGSSCGKDPIRIIKNPTTNETEEAYPDKASGINVSPALPNADGPCTITFTPSSGSDFYGYTGEVYLILESYTKTYGCIYLQNGARTRPNAG